MTHSESLVTFIFDYELFQFELLCLYYFVHRSVYKQLFIKTLQKVMSSYNMLEMKIKKNEKINMKDNRE